MDHFKKVFTGHSDIIGEMHSIKTTHLKNTKMGRKISETKYSINGLLYLGKKNSTKHL